MYFGFWFSAKNTSDVLCKFQAHPELQYYLQNLEHFEILNTFCCLTSSV